MHRLFPDFYCLEGKVGEIGQTKLMCSLILSTAVTLKWEFYNQAAIQKKRYLSVGFNPSHPEFSMHILHTALHSIPIYWQEEFV